MSRKLRNSGRNFGTVQAVVPPPVEVSTSVNASQRLKEYYQRFKLLLATQVSGESLAVMRIAVGLIMVLEAYTLCRPSASTMGKSAVETFYRGPDIKFWFPYAGFHWLPVLPTDWLYAAIGLQGLAGLTMALGFLYRISAATVFVVWGYLYAIESTRTYWMSYYYLELLVTFLLIWMPAARRYSVDAWLARGRGAPRTVPYWTIFLLRAQLVITYFYAGVAKLNADWLLDAQPVRYFLVKSRLLAEHAAHLAAPQTSFIKSLLLSTPFAYFISWAGATFDLSAGFLLLFRRTRALGLVLMLLFHATNHFVIFSDIEWFPLVGVTTALIFLDADWPERFRAWLRRPRLAPPDWRWFFAGGILVPVVGTALGWRSKARPTLSNTKTRHPLGRWVVPGVVVWLVWQALMPLRQYAIAGDGRFTWEGLCFSWRLKADVYRSMPCRLVVEDPKIIGFEGTSQPRIDWTAWHGEKVICRMVVPSQLDWTRLPEVLVLLEPRIGERIIYNPLAGSAPGRTEAEARQRVQAIWQTLYGRQPQTVEPTASLPQILRPYSAALLSSGYRVRTVRDVFENIGKLEGLSGEAQMVRSLRQMTPFALAGAGAPSIPFLLIEDDSLVHEAGAAGWRVDPKAWVQGEATRAPRRSSGTQTGGDPLVVYTYDLGLAARDLLPLAGIFDTLDHPDAPPYIQWNYLAELPDSKSMHMGAQPFLLRQYARHVAAWWQAEYDRRPAVKATTAVSLNGRPFQTLVDPQADLAAVGVAWLRHNSWIRDLEMPRIPRTGPTLLTP